jgi:arylsulfatase A-like enzyme
VVRLSLRAEAEGGGAGGAMLTRPAIGRFEDPPEEERRSPTAPSERPAPAPERPNVIVYLIDTLRADHLGCYGYPREVSPAIDAFARDGVLFEHAVAQSSWTRAGVASLFTGLWPAAHGANRRRHTLSPEALTLAELLSAAGYRTAGIVTNPNVADRFGFAQGFDDYELLSGAESDAASVTRKAVEWLDREGGAGPFFLYLHTVEPHSPYDPPPEHRRRFAPAVPASVAHQPGRLVGRVRSGAIEVGEPLLAEMLALYDGEIAANDEAFGALRSALEERGLYRDAVVAVLSDHGEEFYEHQGFEHGRTLFEESVRVPLVLKLGANGPVGRVARPVQHVDLLPTLLAAAGAPAHGGLEGRDLLEVINREWEEEAAAPRRIFTYIHLDGAPRVSVFGGDFKLIQNRDGERLVRPRLFDLRSDPGETRDLAAERPVLAGYLATLIRHRLHASEGRLQAGEAEIDEELRRRLEAMGYL